RSWEGPLRGASAARRDPAPCPDPRAAATTVPGDRRGAPRRRGGVPGAPVGGTGVRLERPTPVREARSRRRAVAAGGPGGGRGGVVGGPSPDRREPGAVPDLGGGAGVGIGRGAGGAGPRDGGRDGAVPAPPRLRGERSAAAVAVAASVCR